MRPEDVGTKVSKGIARLISGHYPVGLANDYAGLRDAIDLEYGGALDSYKLDMMTEWIQQELHWRRQQKVVKL